MYKINSKCYIYFELLFWVLLNRQLTMFLKVSYLIISKTTFFVYYLLGHIERRTQTKSCKRLVMFIHMLLSNGSHQHSVTFLYCFFFTVTYTDKSKCSDTDENDGNSSTESIKLLADVQLPPRNISYEKKKVI